jgi:ParB family chromosome partitioning protein
VTKRALGRGLDALLQIEEAEPAAGFLLAPVASIRPNPFQPRGEIDGENLAELAASIAAHGMIQPLVVTAAEGGYQLIAGERRWRAAQLAGLAEVPIVVREAEPRDMLAVALIENIQRSDLDPLEAAEGYKRLAEEFGLTQDEVARLVGKSRAAVTNAIRLLALEPEIKTALRNSSLAEGHARALLAVPDSAARLALARRAISEGWSVRQVEEAARATQAAGQATAVPAVAGAQPRAASEAAPDSNDAAAVRALEEALGTRVELRRKGQGGTLVIHFYSGEELVAIHRRVTGS